MKPSALPIPACGHLGTPVVHEATRHETVRFGKLRPSMFMPRWACRLHLDVREVRIERLQKISEADAIAEGIESDSMGSEAFPLWRDYSTGGATVSAQHSYRTLWEMINGPGSWAATPWVVVISFQKVP